MPVLRRDMAWPTAAQLLAAGYEPYRERSAAQLCGAAEQAFYEWRDACLVDQAAYLLDCYRERWLTDGRLLWRAEVLDGLLARYVPEADWWEAPDDDEMTADFCAWALAVLRWVQGYSWRPIDLPILEEAAAYLVDHPPKRKPTPAKAKAAAQVHPQPTHPRPPDRQPTWRQLTMF